MNIRLPVWAAAGAVILVAGTAACNRTPENTTTGVDTSAATPAQNTTQTPDWWTTTKVQARFFADSQVKGRNIDVDTNAGVVTLRGTVDNDIERQQALVLARAVDGVTRVDDQLTVKPVTTAETPMATTGTSVPAEVGAAWITTKIQAQYYGDPTIKPWNIDVTTTGNGHVTLFGDVDNAAERQKVVQIARNTDGVTAVEDELRVRGETASAPAAATAGTLPPASPGPADADGWITARVQSKYFLDEDVKGREIDVGTSNGVVTLRGTVGNDMQHHQAVAIARNTDGVKDVQDYLQVQPAESATPMTVTGTSMPAVTMPDAWITTKIQSKYFIDPAVKSLAVNVDTNDGVVTLTGEVATPNDRKAAEDVARQTRGVKRVLNNIKVAMPGK